MAHLHEIEDRDPYFVIDPDTRTIRNMSSTKTVIAQFDHNSEVFTFGIPREVDGHNMMLCDKVQVHFLNGTNPGVYEIDLTTERELIEAEAEDDEDIVLHSWLISDNATQIAGPLSFALVFMCTRTVTEKDPVSGEDVEKTVVDYRWRTLPHTSINVGASINTSDTTAEKYADILLKWYTELTAAYGDINTAKTEGIEAVEAVKNKAVVDAQNEISNWVQNNQSGIIDDLQEAFSESYTELEADVATIKGILGADEETESVAGLVDRVTELETDVTDIKSTLGDETSGLVAKANTLETNLTTLGTDLDAVESDLVSLKSTLFDEESTGEETTGLVGKVNELIADVEAIETTLGGESAGLVDKVNAMKTGKVDKLTPNDTVRVYAQDASGNEMGLVASSANNANHVIWRDNNGAFSVNDAALPLHPLSKRAFDNITGIDASQWTNYRDSVKPSLQTQINDINAVMSTADFLSSIDNQIQMRMLLGNGYDYRVIFELRNYTGPKNVWKWYKAYSLLLSDGSDWIVTETRDDTTEGARVYIKGEEADNIYLSADGTYHYVPVYDEDGFEIGEAQLTTIPLATGQTIDGKNVYYSTASSSRYILEDPWASRQYAAITRLSNGVTGVEYPTKLYIPYEYAGAPVTTIDDGVFESCPYSEIYIPDSVTYIGENAFANQAILHHVRLGSGLGTIKAGTFVACPQLKTLTIPSSVFQIEDGAFDEHLESLYIDRPEGSISGAPWGAINATITYKED